MGRLWACGHGCSQEQRWLRGEKGLGKAEKFSVGMAKASFLFSPGIWAVLELQSVPQSCDGAGPGRSCRIPFLSSFHVVCQQAETLCLSLRGGAGLFSLAAPLSECCFSFCTPPSIATAQLLWFISARVENKLLSLKTCRFYEF